MGSCTHPRPIPRAHPRYVHEDGERDISRAEINRRYQAALQAMRQGAYRDGQEHDHAYLTASASSLIRRHE